MKTTGLVLGIALSAQLMGVAHAQTAYETEYQRAIQGAVANIQSNGAVIASPSQVNPDYYYDWVRDTSLTMRAIVKLAYDPTTTSSLQSSLLTKINTWINWELGLQVTPKYQDPVTGDTGLGEPRFYITGTTNFNPWGRPQNDGPASRATTAILIANQWISQGRMSDVEAKLYKAELPATTLIKRDLEYVAANWQKPSIDLWEEERGMHFYTLTVQKVALLKGADLANRMSDTAAGTYYAAQAAAIGQYLEQFYDPTTKTLKYAIDSNKLPQKTTNLDIAIVLAAIETYDGQFYVNKTQLASTVKALVANFNTGFKINAVTKNATGTKLGVALGRYPGDTYSGFDSSGGNPWFLATLALAEYYCDVNKTSNHAAAQAQFDRVIYHMNANGDLTEQFNHDNGLEQGAVDLTWSYTSYITAYRACF